MKRCIAAADIEEHNTFQILSDTPLAACPMSPICMGAGRAGFQVFCPGGTGGHALAALKNTARHFTGTIHMKMMRMNINNKNMGGKSMTLIEYQDGRRIGGCASKP